MANPAHTPTGERVEPSSLRTFFEPRTVAVVGASRRRGRVGAEIFHNLTAGAFAGRVIPVNPRAHDIAGVTAYAAVSEIPGAVDLAVIAVPAPCVEAAVDDCLTKGVPAIVVITAGFGETGGDGHAREVALRERVRAAGARLIGPNCMGVLNTDPAVRLNATFSPACPPAGSIAFSSQSGAVGLAVLDFARHLGVGMSAFASVGNKADVSTNDLLEYWADDPRTNVVMLYVESFGNPRRFSRIARRVARVKPIVAVKAGRSAAGTRAATSHTGALAARDEMVDALFDQCGVIRADTLEGLFNTGRFLAQQPLPRGPRVAVLTNAGGPGIMAADACEARGLVLPPLGSATVEGLRRFLPPQASVSNPVDMLATASAGDFAAALPLLLNDDAVDSVIVIFVPPLVTGRAEVARAVAEAARTASKPVLAAFVGGDGPPDETAPAPAYVFPESAAQTLASVMPYVRWRTAPAGRGRTFDDVRIDAARAIVARGPRSSDGWLDPLDAVALVEAFGIRHVPTIAVGCAGDAWDTARHVGLPVALKGTGAGLVHKSDAHAVELDLHTEQDVRRAYAQLAARQGHDVDQILLQPMARGVEFFAGAVLDATFGHVIVCGAGGTTVELVRDTACRLHPLTDADARALLDDVRATALLRGFRGAPAGGEGALVELLLRLSAMLDACPEIAELDANPVMVTPAGARVADVRIRIDRRPHR